MPFTFVWGLWVALVDFLPEVGGALAGIATVLFAAAQSLTAGIVTAVVFVVYTQIENHVLNPVVMSKTVRVSPLFVLVSVLAGASIGWLAGRSLRCRGGGPARDPDRGGAPGRSSGSYGGKPRPMAHRRRVTAS